jgi:calcium/calmodulin-dependent protein kinase I
MPSDIWAIGVITYFLLCGYTPFDRDSNLEEMQAILVADYSFTPIEYWRNVSTTARDFIKRCLTIDPHARMTAHEALQHAWIADTDTAMSGEDLLPTVKKNFNARRTLHAAIDTIRAINQLRAGQGAAMMDGALSRNPERQGGQAGGGGGGGFGGFAGAAGMVMDSRGNAKGQTEEQIQEQERRIGETLKGLWNGRS